MTSDRRLTHGGLREVTEAVLAVAIVAAAIYMSAVEEIQTGPVVNWAGVIVGVYFGAAIGQRISNGQHAEPLRRRLPPLDEHHDKEGS